MNTNLQAVSVIINQSGEMSVYTDLLYEKY